MSSTSVAERPASPRRTPIALYQPEPEFDLLRTRLGRLLRRRWGRLAFQLPLLALAALLIYDGLTGPQLAPQNLATVIVWVHYRGLVVLALLLVGNLFCMGCPFTLPRTLARRLSGRGRRWPKALRNKWLAIALLVLSLWAYEWLDLWASPLLTAWFIIAYFAAAFVLEALFAESPFCKYVCPLGTFNFVSATVSPYQIVARDHDVCRTCVGKECVNGSAQVLGCGTELFVPAMRTNLDCVLCLDCVRACPYDNVALARRPRLHEVYQDSYPRRWDVAFLFLVFAFAGLGNGFGMVPPVYTLAAWLSGVLGTRNEALLLAIILGTIMVAMPVGLGLAAAWLSRRRGTAQERQEPLRVTMSRYAPAILPLAFAVWFAHYTFHFLTGALTAIPVLQNFLLDHGIAWLGREPNWSLAALLPMDWITALNIVVVVVGLMASLSALGRRGSRPAQMPWMVLFLLVALAAVVIFTLPMEMRGLQG